MADFFKIGETNLVTGPVRVLMAPTSQAVPTKINDIIEIQDADGYDPKGSWFDVGATDEAPSISRDMDDEDLRVSQSTAVVLNRITEVSRTFTVPFHEHTPELIKIIEQGSAIGTIAAVAGTSVQQKYVDAGAFQDRDPYRIAFILQKDRGTGAVVTESNDVERGAFVAIIGYNVQISAADSDWEPSNDEFATREVEFTTLAEPTIANGEIAYVRYLWETPGDIGSA